MNRKTSAQIRSVATLAATLAAALSLSSCHLDLKPNEPQPQPKPAGPIPSPVLLAAPDPQSPGFYILSLVDTNTGKVIDKKAGAKLPEPGVGGLGCPGSMCSQVAVVMNKAGTLNPQNPPVPVGPGYPPEIQFAIDVSLNAQKTMGLQCEGQYCQGSGGKVQSPTHQ